MLTKKASESKPVSAIGFWIALIAVVLIVGLLLHSQSFNDLVEDATNWAEGVINQYPVAGAVVFFVLSAASAMLAFASAVILVPPATEVWGKPRNLPASLGRMASRSDRRVRNWPARTTARDPHGYKHKLEEYERLVSKHMKFWAVLLFCIALQSEIPGYLFGGMRYSLPKFVVAIGIAEAIYAVAVIAAGESILNAKPLPLIAIAGTLVVVAIGAGLLLRRFRKRRS